MTALISSRALEDAIVLASEQLHGHYVKTKSTAVLSASFESSVVKTYALARFKTLWREGDEE